MIKIKDFIETGFEVSWTLLYLGVNGSEIFKNQLDGQDIIDYAAAKMKEGDDSLDVVLLANANAANIDEINELLFRLSNYEVVDCDDEYRKWQIIYVLKHLPDEHADYIQGLTELGNIWTMLGFPDDSPHVFQGRNNSMTPEEYYTRENYLLLLDKHREWIEKEISQLKNRHHLCGC